MQDSLLHLFRRCLSARYTHAREGGDYCVEMEGRRLFLLFEWSNGREDWHNNLDFPAVPYRGQKKGERWYCHRGFVRVWKGIRDEVSDVVSETLVHHPGIREIFCIGYSHGAALALLATEDMVYRFGERGVHGYGFGCPRVVFGRLPEKVAGRLDGFLVIRNVPDLVTHLPPALLGFRHVGALLEIGKGIGYSPIAAHTPEAYIRSLTECRNGCCVSGREPSGIVKAAYQTGRRFAMSEISSRTASGSAGKQN